jgi:hypothetical protein
MEVKALHCPECYNKHQIFVTGSVSVPVIGERGDSGVEHAWDWGFAEMVDTDPFYECVNCLSAWSQSEWL